jgi:anti-sigma B factor antagonist
MKIDVIEVRGVKTIAVSGDIDMYSSNKLRDEIMCLIDKKVLTLHVDFKEVSYMDSSGIATFVEALKTMKTYGGRLKLICIPEPIMEIFRFSRLDRVFEIYGDINDAINI